MLRFLRDVLDTCRRERLVPRGSVVVCGLSGGPDSVALLRALRDLEQPLDCRVVAAHLDHALRSDSAEDEAFCERLAREWDVPYHAERASPTELRAEGDGGPENAARRARYGFLARVAAREGGVVAVGHHAGDRAETFLAQLLRGAGPRGLSLPRYRREDGLIRPLLDRTRAEILEFLETRGIPYRTDPTNLDGSNLRSRLRTEVFPLLQRENPDAVGAIARAAGSLAAVDDFLDRSAECALGELRIAGPRGELTLDGPRGRTYHRAVLSSLLRKAVRGLGTRGALGFEPVERCVRAWKRGGRLVLDVPGRVRISVEPDRVTLARTDRPQPAPREQVLPVPGRVLWSGSRETGGGCVHLTVETRTPPEDPRSASGPTRAWIDAARVEAPLRVRCRRPGDRYRPLGLGGSVKVQDLFVDRKIPRACRDSVPVVADARGILWIPGFRVDQRGRITETTDTALRLEVRGDPE
jgi:tRNA(Ile)-lysidine synthase